MVHLRLGSLGLDLLFRLGSLRLDMLSRLLSRLIIHLGLPIRRSSPLLHLLLISLSRIIMALPRPPHPLLHKHQKPQHNDSRQHRLHNHIFPYLLPPPPCHLLKLSPFAPSPKRLLILLCLLLHRLRILLLRLLIILLDRLLIPLLRLAEPLPKRLEILVKIFILTASFRLETFRFLLESFLSLLSARLHLGRLLLRFLKELVKGTLHVLSICIPPLLICCAAIFLISLIRLILSSLESRSEPFLRLLIPQLSELIVLLPRLSVAQHVVSVCELLELVLIGMRIRVGVVLPGQFIIFFFDPLVGGCLRQAQDLVVILGRVEA